MPARIAFCGLDCARCPAFQPSQTEELGPHQKIAQKWWRARSNPPASDGASCHGCQRSVVPRYHMCQNCAIRACGLEHGFDTCADCPAYPCEKLDKLLDIAPSARDNLEALRRRLNVL